MSRLRVIICRVDDQTENQMTELASFEVPEVEVSRLSAATGLDHLESNTLTVGQQGLRGLLIAQWQEVDQALVAAQRQDFSPRPDKPGRT